MGQRDLRGSNDSLPQRPGQVRIHRKSGCLRRTAEVLGAMLESSGRAWLNPYRGLRIRWAPGFMARQPAAPRSPSLRSEQAVAARQTAYRTWGRITNRYAPSKRARFTGKSVLLTGRKGEKNYHFSKPTYKNWHVQRRPGHKPSTSAPCSASQTFRCSKSGIARSTRFQNSGV